jgi:hypothetical protein
MAGGTTGQHWSEEPSRVVLGDEQQRALQEAATAAIHATARQLRPEPVGTDDPEGPDHLARVIDQVFQAAPTPDVAFAEHPTLLEGLQAGVAARLALLDDAEITGTHKSSAEVLHVSVRGLTDLLTERLLKELLVRGVGGGPLAPLADQLNHDVTHLQGREHHAAHVGHNASLARLIRDVQSALATRPRGAPNAVQCQPPRSCLAPSSWAPARLGIPDPPTRPSPPACPHWLTGSDAATAVISRAGAPRQARAGQPPPEEVHGRAGVLAPVAVTAP